MKRFVGMTVFAVALIEARLVDRGLNLPDVFAPKALTE
jgi:hypothetical protein